MPLQSQIMNLIINLNEWFGLKYEIIYFYNVYGPHQIYNSNKCCNRHIRRKF